VKKVTCVDPNALKERLPASPLWGRLTELHALGRFSVEKLVTFYPFKDINQAIEDSLNGKCVKPILRF
jgi:Zn-dependent alcohol dehydrogenase